MLVQFPAHSNTSYGWSVVGNVAAVMSLFLYTNVNVISLPLRQYCAASGREAGG
jgi:hypothetical protein